MNTNQKIVIATLTITAVLLSAMLLGVLSGDRPAYAGYTGMSAGNYILVPFMISGSTDLVCLINVPGRSMQVYNAKPDGSGVDLVPDSLVDLEKAFSQ